jgi:putative thioredoxin
VKGTLDVDEATFDERVVDASREAPVVVDFWAGWCRPCLVLGPTLERLAGEHGVRLVKVDVDANPRLAARFGIQGIPAVKAFRDGDVVSEFVGAQPEAVVRAFLADLVPSPADELAEEGAGAERRGDVAAAEGAYLGALKADPSHAGAAVGLSRILASRGEDDEARTLLARVPEDPEGRRVLAELELRAGGYADGDLGDASAAAARGEHRRALEEALRLIEQGGPSADRARDLMVRVFEVLGEDDPLTREFRPLLAAALF